MSNILIDRNAVMDYLREQQANVIIEKNKNGFVNADVCDGMSSAIGAFMNFILQIPTAYDVDKVVEEMQDLLWDCYTDSGVGIDRKTGFEAYKREMERILRH
ncbi:MAG: hypothetical protein HFI03_13945 [Lachnospiraceae bacterium]|jgi:hypothetical protein|nr:hypothetical protein [Lachnospiraceae bacterium]